MAYRLAVSAHGGQAAAQMAAPVPHLPDVAVGEVARYVLAGLAPVGAIRVKWIEIICEPMRRINASAVTSFTRKTELFPLFKCYHHNVFTH
jgi:hypothetical protein